MRRMVVANWKMNLDHIQARAVLKAMRPCLLKAEARDLDVVVLPSFTALHAVCQATKKHDIPVAFGAQNVSDTAKGAYTGDISAQMLKALGCSYVLIGHSERRRYHAESDECITGKIQAVLDAGMTPILCVGESKHDSDSVDEYGIPVEVENQLAGELEGIAPKDLSRVVIAYEPVWAIGSGKALDSSDAWSILDGIRKYLSTITGARVRILYGGSVDATNARSLAREHIDGVLVGGASLHADTFKPIVKAFLD